MSSNAVKWVKKLVAPVVIVLALAAVIAIIIGYFDFIDKQVDANSERHLKEIYGQINTAFNSYIDRNWGLLESCDDYYDLLAQQASGDIATQMGDYIEAKKEYWGFTDFYFLKEDRSYMSIGGVEGNMTDAAPIEELIQQKKPIMAGEKIDDVYVTVFAIAAEGVFNGFEFSAIGISYTNTDIAKTLSANAYIDSEGNSAAESYIVRPNGDVLFSTYVGGGFMDNYFEHLSGTAPDDVIQSIKDNIAKLQESGEENAYCYAQYTLKKDKDQDEVHCIIYMPVGYENYAILSDVPQTEVSQGFLLAQRATMRVMIIILTLIIAAVLIVLIIKIVSQSMRSKRELLYREKMFDVLSNTVNDIFLMLDPETEKVDYISPNIERLLGIKLKTARENIRSLITCAVDYNIVVPNDELQAIPIGSSKTWECEYMHQATGERRWYRVAIYHMNIQNMEKYVVVMSDRTQDKQLNEKLQEALDAAKSANEAKSNFLSNMSHDIRTPMNAIVGFSVLLERNADDADSVREYTRKIMASSHHLLSLINDVLDMSKIESGKTSLNTERFSLPDLLEELNIIIMPQAKAKQQDFTITTHGAPPDHIMGDRLRLNQILLNLLSNAIKYTPEGGTISFDVQDLSDETSDQFTKIRFVVKDNGIGMSEAYIKEIFKPFSRETNSVVNAIQGTGLGMAITKNLVDLMGGIINVESEPGKGSTFTVELSFACAQDAPQDEWYQQKISKMLVADDEEEICLNIREMMRGTGIDVNYVTDGASAVEVAVKAHENDADYHVILLDWKMPGMDGVETARQIREKVGHDVPILVLTSYDWSDIEAEAKEAGINAFMPKPFFTSTFLQTVKPLFDAQTDADTSPEPEEENSLDGKMFLVAEDNGLNAEILTEMLDIEGAKCEVAQNGKIAVEMFEAAAPDYYDMILMDVQMPVMNGYEATKAIRALPRPDAKDIPIVAMTANTFAEDVQAALNAGMDAHLAKPINMDVVRKTVAQLLEKRQKGEHN